MTISFKYKNWKNIISIRKVKLIKFWIGSTEFHKNKQVFMKALDVNKQEERDFAVKDIIEIY